VILITTALNSLSGLIPTEIGQMTELTHLTLRKYDGCLRAFHALFFIYLTYFVLFSPLIALNSPTTSPPRALLSLLFCGTGANDLTGQIPSELQTLLPLSTCSLSECLAFSPPLPLCITLAGFVSHACHRDYSYCR
jgi:hypothetical protein